MPEAVTTVSICTVKQTVSVDKGKHMIIVVKRTEQCSFLKVYCSSSRIYYRFAVELLFWF